MNCCHEEVLRYSVFYHNVICRPLHILDLFFGNQYHAAVEGERMCAYVSAMETL